MGKSKMKLLLCSFLLRISFATVKTLENYVLVKENENLEPLSYNYVWLRENCRCTECYNSTTYQRNILPLDIPHNIKPTSVTLSENTLHVTWSDNHVSEYCSTWLQSLGEAEKGPESILWSGDINNKVAHVSKDDLSSQSGLKQLVQSILQYGVGFVTQVPTNVKATEEVINKIGLPLHTFYGAGMWEFADTLDYLDTSYTNIELGAHTDTTYFIEPAGLIIFHCTQHDGEGGKTLLVDGFRAAKDVKLADPKLYNCLKTVSTEFSCIDREYHFTSCKPTLSFTPQDQLELVRYNVYDRSARIPGPRNEVDVFYKSLKLYGDAIKKTSGEWWFKLQPGTVAFVNNWRVLHGRSAYTGYRKIIGSYMSMGNFLSKARLLKLIV